MRDRTLVGLVLLLLAAAVKAPALLALPLAVAWAIRGRPRERMPQALAGLVLGGAAVLALYLPFWEGPRTFAALVGEGGYYTASIGTVVHRLLQRLTSEGAAAVIANLVLRGGFLALYGVAIMRVVGRGDALMKVCAIAFFLYLALAAFWFMPWYAVWPLGLAAASAQRAAIIPCLLLALTAMLNHAVFGFGAAALGVSPASSAVEAAATLAIWSAPLAGAGVLAWKSRRGASSGRQAGSEVKIP
jgi:hypothetical protein